MTQSFTFDNSLIDTFLTNQSEEGSTEVPSSQQPAILHPNFDPERTPLDPARPLSDIPEPARHVNSQLRRLYGKSMPTFEPTTASLSKWQLLASEAFAEHLALLSAAKLIALPQSFYESNNNSSAQPLLTALEHMTLLDMADIQRAMKHYPTLTRYGFAQADTHNQNSSQDAKHKAEPTTLRSIAKAYNPDELLNSLYADDWQVILQPQDFESGIGSLATDIMACSVAVHALKQCGTRKTVNKSYSAAQICQYVRSYVLSQLNIAPASRQHYRQIRVFTGHIIVAAYHLGWDIQVSAECYVNISSRCGLLTRYANMQDYVINGWSP